MQESVKKNNRLLSNAKNLRRNMTKQEKHLWYDFLQKYPIKFYKQRIIDNYIVDFYCAKAKLVIELDGSQHFTEQSERYDQNRSQVLKKYGLHVMRFTNLDITQRFEGVCTMIHEYIQKTLLDNIY